MYRCLPGLTLAALCLVAPATAQQGNAQPPKPATKKSAFDKPTLEAYVRNRFFWGSQYAVKIADPTPAPLPGFKEIVIEVSAGNASKQIPLYISNDGQKIVFGEVYDIAQNPFQADLAKLNTAFQPAFGAEGAPVNLVMFSDFQCGFCREEAKSIRENIAKSYPKQVRVYFKDYPLESIHPWAKTAAVAGRCVYRQSDSGFWDYHDWIFEHQPEITGDNLKAKVLEFAAAKKLDSAALSQCIDNRTTEVDVNHSVAEGKSLSIDFTPTLFVNGRRLVGKIEWPVLAQIIDHEIEYQKANHSAADPSCCEVKLPSPFKN